jgi:hypothetical protein
MNAPAIPQGWNISLLGRVGFPAATALARVAVPTQDGARRVPHSLKDQGSVRSRQSKSP